MNEFCEKMLITLPKVFYWTTLFNVFIQNHFDGLTTICLLWHKNWNLELVINATKPQQFVSLKLESTAATENSIEILKSAIEINFCEGFIAFQEDISKLSQIFQVASSIAKKSILRPKFLFAYETKVGTTELLESCAKHQLFTVYSDILIIETADNKRNEFRLWTNKFQALLDDEPGKLVQIGQYVHLQFDTTSLVTDTKFLLQQKVLNLKGRELVVGTVDYAPYMVLDYEKPTTIIDKSKKNAKGLVLVDGTEVRILYTFCELYNCTIQADTSESENWGYIYENGTGFGVLRLLLEQKIDIVMGAWFAWDVNSYIQMSYYLSRSGVTCLVPVPKVVTTWALPLEPFQSNLWFAIILCLMLETLTLAAVYYTSVHLYEQFEVITLNQSLSISLGSTLQIFISQSPSIEALNLSVRTFLVFCLMLDIIITSIYSGGLAAILTLPKYEKAADSLERLNKHNLLWVGTSIDWIFSLMKDNESATMQNIVKNFRLHTIEEMRELAKTENLGFVVDRTTFGHFGNTEFLTADALARLKLMTDDIYYQFTIAWLPRPWVHLEKFNELIFNWHAAGLAEYWERKITMDFMDVQKQNQIAASMFLHFSEEPIPLNITNFAGIILIWIFGINLSILMFCCESLFYKWRYCAEPERKYMQKKKKRKKQSEP